MNDTYEEKLLSQQMLLNEAVEQSGYDLSNPMVLMASIEYDHLTNEWMALNNR